MEKQFVIWKKCELFGEKKTTAGAEPGALPACGGEKATEQYYRKWLHAHKIALTTNLIRQLSPCSRDY